MLLLFAAGAILAPAVHHLHLAHPCSGECRHHAHDAEHCPICRIDALQVTLAGDGPAPLVKTAPPERPVDHCGAPSPALCRPDLRARDPPGAA